MRHIMCVSALVLVVAMTLAVGMAIIGGGEKNMAAKNVAKDAIDSKTATASSLQRTQTCAAEEVVVAQMFGKSAKLDLTVAGDANDGAKTSARALVGDVVVATNVVTNDGGTVSTALITTTAQDVSATAKMDTTRAPGLTIGTSSFSTASTCL